MVKVTQKPPTDMVEISFPYNNPPSGMGEGVSTKDIVNYIDMTDVSIDKLSINYKMPDMDDRGYLEERLKDLKNAGFDELKIVKVYSRSYKYSVKIVGEECQQVLIQCTPRSKEKSSASVKKSFLRIEYNPNNYQDEGAHEALWKMLRGFLFMHTLPKHFWEHAAVTRLDLAQDAFGVLPEQIAVEGHKHRKRVYYLNDKRKLETLYMGLTDNVVKIYGKSQEIKDKKHTHYPESYHENNVTRIEISRKLKKAIPLAKLKQDKNPFEKLKLYDLRPLQVWEKKVSIKNGKAVMGSTYHNHVALFAEMWLLKGLNKALEFAPLPQYRRRYKNLADMCHAEYWDDNKPKYLGEFHRQHDEIRKGLLGD